MNTHHHNGIVWFEGLGFDIGARVALMGAEAQAEAGARAGSVVGFDASGPREGEDFIRVLVQPDGPDAKIVALPPAALRPEEGSELAGLARAILAGLEQSLTPNGFAALLAWLAGPEGQALAADPSIRRQRVQVGGLRLPGLTLPELVALAQARQAP
ncbi:hypothetical protein [Candidatus Viridilinea mediisalina]|uniref:Uncharacterized protein n=1 Tax=Candidatus Viridilinea mediisalina TaxID=2024553 RepID=A0A2A6RN41_9CHLR|nr:hypothetical protein [Candidatus Viridilinea mediisalina]PDW04504.1 hypothetical protein CJ255_03035 [Candidatus Viridilinea mediisalina]